MSEQRSDSAWTSLSSRLELRAEWAGGISTIVVRGTTRDGMPALTIHVDDPDAVERLAVELMAAVEQARAAAREPEPVEG